MKKFMSLVLVSAILLSLCGCSGGSDKATKLSFSGATSYASLKTLDGRKVEINGYMATVSPVSGKFIYLVNLPYQSCPFCVPNTAQLSNTMAIYAKDGKTFRFSGQAIKVTGTLEIGDFTDEYGYTYNYRIIDASYVEIDTSNLTEDQKLWQQIASTDVISEIYAMYDYINFLCSWNTYSTTGESGQQFYLYPDDALFFIKTDGAQFNYGYKDGYFDSIIDKIKSVSATKYTDLIDIIERSKTLADKALKELEDGNYTSEYKYIEEFGTSDYVYTLNIGTELGNDFTDDFYLFAVWLGNYEI